MRYICFLTLLMAITVQPTSIHFQMDISCQIFTNCFPNTAVVTVGPKCLDHRGTIALNTNGEIAGDGWFDNRLEFMGEVTHNCTRRGETLMFHRRLGYYPDHLIEIRRKFRVEVNEKGVKQ